MSNALWIEGAQKLAPKDRTKRAIESVNVSGDMVVSKMNFMVLARRMGATPRDHRNPAWRDVAKAVLPTKGRNTSLATLDAGGYVALSKATLRKVATI